MQIKLTHSAWEFQKIPFLSPLPAAHNGEEELPFYLTTLGRQGFMIYL